MKDHNTGLVLQVVDAFRRFSILKLENTYVALRIAEVAERTSPDPKNYVETAHYIMTLIKSKQLNAELNETSEDPQHWILRFAQTPTSGPQARTEQRQYSELLDQTRRTSRLIVHVRDVDQRLGLSKEYIDWAKKAQKTKDASNDFNLTMFSNDDYIGDEDMMADL